MQSCQTFNRDPADVPAKHLKLWKLSAKSEQSECPKDVVAQKILSHGHSGDPSRKAKLLERRQGGPGADEKSPLINNLRGPTTWDVPLYTNSP